MQVRTGGQDRDGPTSPRHVALLHIDAYSAPKFLAPGHRVTGDRDKNNRARGLGKPVVIAVQDDHRRLVYAELHSSENAINVSATLRRPSLPSSCETVCRTFYCV